MDNLEEHQREMRERNSAASKRKHAIAMGKRVLILEVKNQRLRERSPQHPVTKQSRVRDRTQPSDLEWTFKPTIDVAFTLIDPR